MLHEAIFRWLLQPILLFKNSYLPSDKKCNSNFFSIDKIKVNNEKNAFSFCIDEKRSNFRERERCSKNKFLTYVQSSFFIESLLIQAHNERSVERRKQQMTPDKILFKIKFLWFLLPIWTFFELFDFLR